MGKRRWSPIGHEDPPPCYCSLGCHDYRPGYFIIPCLVLRSVALSFPLKSSSSSCLGRERGRTALDWSLVEKSACARVVTAEINHHSLTNATLAPLPFITQLIALLHTLLLLLLFCNSSSRVDILCICTRKDQLHCLNTQSLLPSHTESPYHRIFFHFPPLPLSCL